MKVRCACGDVRAYENGLAKRSGFVNPGLHTPASQSMVVIRTVKYVQSCIAHRSNGEIAASLRHPFGSTIDREVLNRPMAEGSLLPILSVSFQRVLCSGANVRIGHQKVAGDGQVPGTLIFCEIQSVRQSSNFAAPASTSVTHAVSPADSLRGQSNLTA